MIRISLADMISQLIGARALDKFRWTNLNMEESLINQFAYDDRGATYIAASGEERE